MAIIKSGASSDQLTVDATSKAARVSRYDSAGRENSFQKTATYSVGIPAFTPPATPTDLFTITGSGTKTVRVISVLAGFTQTTAGNNRIYTVKRSTANSGGSSSAPTAVPFDSTNAAATATVLSYTGNSTPGSLVGNLAINNCYSPILATGTSGPDYQLTPNGIVTELLAQPVTLRGTGEVLAINFNGAALPSGLSVVGTIVWLEE